MDSKWIILSDIKWIILNVTMTSEHYTECPTYVSFKTSERYHLVVLSNLPSETVDPRTANATSQYPGQVFYHVGSAHLKYGGGMTYT